MEGFDHSLDLGCGFELCGDAHKLFVGRACFFMEHFGRASIKCHVDASECPLQRTFEIAALAGRENC
ncbi:Uncharacterised protein [Mycobacteroides abscessus subsp. abscessus]|nr:Uncharacterised protein [Mycobacteroides abscessus subsp. abscessus]SIC78785.1 Uncharacterised protein [Mycobacteroides abscessus subsp. abscessus]SKP27022.1 Uncharacterised protein [Mycobacteroides abscessus subsp. abscessus]